MNWKKEITSMEVNNDWKSAIQLLENIDSNDPELYLRVIFLLLDLVVEGQYTEEEHDYAAEKLKKFFFIAKDKFYNNCEFLFFSGIMIYIAECYFGMDNVNPGTVMLETAMRMEPDNILYKWGYYSTINQCAEHNTDLKLKLSEHLLFKETSKLEWLKSKGLLGRYILGRLEGSYEYLKKLRSNGVI